MAAAASAKYGQGAVYGTLAYDFNNPELYPEEYSRPQTPAARPRTQTQTRVRTRAKTAARTKQGIAPTAILGALVAAFLLVTGVLAQVQLFSVSDGAVELEQQLAELEQQQAKLKIAYESAFNLAEIEDYAMSSLGMQKPKADQVYYIDTSSPDKAVVVAQSEGESLVDRAADFLSGLGAYFG